MPDRDGKLSPEEKKLVGERFNELEQKLGRDVACGVCGTTTWYLNDYVVGLVSDTPVGLGTMRTPSVVFFCTNCAHMMFFAARPMGIVPIPPDDEKSEAGTGEESADGGS